MIINNEEYLTATESAKVLGVSLQLFCKWVERRYSPPHVVHFKKKYFKKSDVEQWKAVNVKLERKLRIKRVTFFQTLSHVNSRITNFQRDGEELDEALILKAIIAVTDFSVEDAKLLAGLVWKYN